jgi:RNA polymerase sigma-70 factor (ECF subfamily)
MFAAQVLDDSADPIAALIRSGDHRAAVAECAKTHGAVLGRLCMAMLGSQQDAEEVVQETLIAAHSAMAKYRGDGSVKAWLYGIARRQCARHLERRKRAQRRLELVPEDADGGPAGLFAKKRRARAIRDALDKLKPSERDALLLRYQAGLSYREIGQACGIEEATARKRASRGLDRLRSLVTPEEVE